jgi:glycosyltransferase involved in cell wall biosynthesis
MRHKVLFISSWYPTAQNKTHGIFVKRYAEAIALHHDVAVIHTSAVKDQEEELKIESNNENNVFEVFVFYKKKWRNPFSKFNNYKKKYFAGLDYLLANWEKPDLVQVNVFFPAGIAGMAIAEKLNVPFIVSEHWTGYDPADGSYKGSIKKYFTKLVASKAAAIITVSEDQKKKMLSHELTGDYSVIPNVVNVSVFKPTVTKRSARFRFLHVSSLDPRQKNVEGILEAFKKLHAEHPATELYIIGSSDHQAELEKQAGSCLNESIYFPGPKFDTELANEYNSADCLVLFSNYENLPVVMLEALCCGVPVISADVGGIREWLNEKNGILIPAGKGEKLLSAMKEMIDHKDGYNRTEISNLATQNFNYHKIAAEFSEVYDKVLKK